MKIVTHHALLAGIRRTIARLGRLVDLQRVARPVRGLHVGLLELSLPGGIQD